ncbi:TonB-dependent receptor domain-containing protein [Robiginitalea sp. SC105]|uniref:TonB-dependent receptor n=1 Tax=Robiginitalea sp. SC105 TaxID=2762332 RepID=UPI0021080C97|nr:TonB-dependent receptor [Robiginitalea sp. SC105]
MWLVLILVLLPATILAQGREATISVRVVNAGDNTPLEGVQVAIRECRCGGLTDREGRFSKVLPFGNYQIEFFYLGFRGVNREVRLRESVELEVQMQEQAEELSEVVLRARKITENLESPQMGALELEMQEIKKIPMAAGEFDVLRGMTLLPGVNNAGEISNGLSVRGGSLDQNLILYDYAPVFNPTHLFGLFSVFTPEVISQVDLYRANIPARFGGRTSSVLDVKTRNPYPSKFSLNGGVGLVSSRLAIETPLVKDKLNLSLGGRAGFTDFLLPLFSERLDNTRARFHDTTLKLLWLAGENDQVALTGFYSWDFYQLDLITKIQDINAANNQYEFRTLNGTLAWTHVLDEKSSMRNILVASDYQPENIFPEQESDNEIRYESSIRYLSLTSEYLRFATESVDWYAGMQAARYRIAPGSLDPGSGNGINPVELETENSYEFGVYANLNWKPLEALSLSAGLRLNHFVLVGPFTQPTFDPVTGNLTATSVFEKGAGVKTYNGLEPRIGLNYTLAENTSVKASYARLNQYLQNLYNTTTPLPTSRWKTSDPLIGPQQSDAFGLGIYQGLADNEMEVSLEGYYRASRNNLTYKAGADFFLEPYLQREVIQAEGKAYGLELSFRKPEGKVNGWFNYTYSRSFLRSDGDALRDRINNNEWYPSEFDRPHVFNSTVNFEGDLYNTWSFNFTLQSGRPYSAPNSVFRYGEIDIPIFLERNNARLRPYHRLDFSWTIRYGKKLNRRWVGDWTFTVYNVYGRRNPFNLFYSQRQGSENGDIFLESPLGSYELSVVNSPVFALTYNFSFD